MLPENGSAAAASTNDVEVSIIMPVYNEQETVVRAIEAVLAADVGGSFELIVVDDGSRDRTSAILGARNWSDNVRVLTHERNAGKGAAVRTGLRAARGTYATVMDADLEYDAADIKLVIEPLRSGEAQVVYGTRGFTSHSSYSFWYVVGNHAVTVLAGLIYNSWLSDMMTGHKAMATELFRSLDLRERGFAIEAEITARLLRARLRIYEVPVVYRARSREAGKKLTAMDGLRVLRTLIRCRFS